jgi:hypothetical protein
MRCQDAYRNRVRAARIEVTTTTTMIMNVPMLANSIHESVTNSVHSALRG